MIEIDGVLRNGYIARGFYDPDNNVFAMPNHFGGFNYFTVLERYTNLDCVTLGEPIKERIS